VFSCTGTPLAWPAPESLFSKFVAHYLWDRTEREHNPEHGMPEDVAIALRLKSLLRSPGPHAQAAVRRRLTSWSILARWRGLTGSFSVPSLKSALRLAVKASDRPRRRKNNKAATSGTLTKLLTTSAGDNLGIFRGRSPRGTVVNTGR
jgi:hypothetical protein